MNDLTVVLLCHDRPKTAVEAIQSVMQQSNSNFDFLVSDNSTNDELQAILKADFPAIKTIFWKPNNGTYFDHFNKIIALIETKYITLLHDDDILDPNYVMKILEQFKETPSVAAIATNGYYIDLQNRRVGGELVHDGHFFKATETTPVFNDKQSIVERYLALDCGGAAPFDSYAYNLKTIKDLHLDFSRGGKYCDTIFLMDVVSRGAIVWINEPLVRVRLHGMQISASCGVRDYKGFITTMLRETDGEINQFSVDEYRFRNLFYNLRKRKRFPIPALKFIFRMIPLLLIRSPVFRKRVFARLFQQRFNSNQ